jgi:hypothetical protein
MLAEVVATEFEFSETRYAQKEDISIAYQWSVTEPSILS